MAEAIAGWLVAAVVTCVLATGCAAAGVSALAGRRARRAGFAPCRRRAENWAGHDWGPPFGVGNRPRARREFVGAVQGRPARCLTWERRMPPAPPAPGQPRDAARIELFGVYCLRLDRPAGRIQVRRRNEETAFHDLPGLRAAPTGDPRFDAAFEVQAENAGDSGDILVAEVREYLLGSDLPGFRIAGGHLLVLERHGLPVRGLDVKIATFGGLVARLPRGASLFP